MALMEWAIDVLHESEQWDTTGLPRVNPYVNQILYELKAVTRLHEVGIASNRSSGRNGETKPSWPTNCPSQAGS